MIVFIPGTDILRRFVHTNRRSMAGLGTWLWLERQSVQIHRAIFPKIHHADQLCLRRHLTLLGKDVKSFARGRDRSTFSRGSGGRASLLRFRSSHPPEVVTLAASFPSTR